MDNVTFYKIAGIDGIEVEHAIIDRGNNEYTSMPKSVYDEMIAAQSTPIVTEDE
jgi:predicted aspartyl protease